MAKILGQRGRMALVFVVMWVFLAFWSLSAFWAHIDSLNSSHPTGSKFGAAGGEFALLALVLFHCFSKHLGVRFWAVVLGFILAGVILVHSGALYGMEEAHTAQTTTEDRLAQKLTAMSNEQAAAVGNANARASVGRSQRERLALANKTNAAQSDIAKAAQSTVAEEIKAGTDKVKDTSILPRWYLDGWMYSVIFILALASLSIIALLHLRDDIDADFDGRRDAEQSPFPSEIDTEARVNGSNRRPNLRANVATRDATLNANVATQKGIDIVRDALRELAKPGHFYFKAEEKQNGVLIRQVAGVKGREEVLNSYLVRSRANLLAFAVKHRENLPYVTASLKTMLIREGFNLESEVK